MIKVLKKLDRNTSTKSKFANRYLLLKLKQTIYILLEGKKFHKIMKKAKRRAKIRINKNILRIRERIQKFKKLKIKICHHPQTIVMMIYNISQRIFKILLEISSSCILIKMNRVNQAMEKLFRVFLIALLCSTTKSIGKML